MEQLPIPSAPMIAWVVQNEAAIVEAFATLNRVKRMTVRLTAPAGPQTAGTPILESPQNIIVEIPLGFARGIANATDATSVITQLNLLLAALRQTGQLPS